MNFYQDLHIRYCPELPMKQFSDIIRNLEDKLFDEHPEYLQLPIEYRNIAIEEAYRKRIFMEVL